MPSRTSVARWLLGAAALFLVAAVPAQAQRRFGSESWDRDCNRQNNRDTERFCRTTESTIQSPSGTLVIDGRTNGGVSVYGL